MNIICIGEMLVDFVCTDKGLGLNNGVNYVRKSGGAPANVAACIAKLGGNVSLVSSVGSDPFGESLISEVQSYNVNTDNVAILPMSTTLAYVSLDENGDREFIFNRGADEHLCISNELLGSLTQDTILHLGSATALLGGALAESYMSIAQEASRKGSVICFDPNFRLDLWKNREYKFKELCDSYFELADIVKISDEELRLFSEQEDIHKGCDYFHNFGVKVVLVTLGGSGCLISQNGRQTIVPAYKINVVDTTGAGDSFIGALLFKLAGSSPGSDFYFNEIAEFVAFAGKVSGLVCSRIGAMSALPKLYELESMEFETNNT